MRRRASRLLRQLSESAARAPHRLPPPPEPAAGSRRLARPGRSPLPAIAAAATAAAARTPVATGPADARLSALDALYRRLPPVPPDWAAAGRGPLLGGPGPPRDAAGGAAASGLGGVRAAAAAAGRGAAQAAHAAEDDGADEDEDDGIASSSSGRGGGGAGGASAGAAAGPTARAWLSRHAGLPWAAIDRLFRSRRVRLWRPGDGAAGGEAAAGADAAASLEESGREGGASGEPAGAPSAGSSPEAPGPCAGPAAGPGRVGRASAGAVLPVGSQLLVPRDAWREAAGGGGAEAPGPPRGAGSGGGPAAAAPAAPASAAESAAARAWLERLILYEDEDLFVINKPAGLPCQGGHGLGPAAHLVGKLAALPRPAGADAPRLVHRLDRDVSGALVLAKSKRSAAALAGAFAAKAAAGARAAAAGQRGAVSRPRGDRWPGEDCIRIDAYEEDGDESASAFGLSVRRTYWALAFRPLPAPAPFRLAAAAGAPPPGADREVSLRDLAMAELPPAGRVSLPLRRRGAGRGGPLPMEAASSAAELASPVPLPPPRAGRGSAAAAALAAAQGTADGSLFPWQVAVTDYRVRGRALLPLRPAPAPTPAAPAAAGAGAAATWAARPHAPASDASEGGVEVFWLELLPVTGRRHQLRAHAAAGLRAPLVGDGAYDGGFLAGHAAAAAAAKAAGGRRQERGLGPDRAVDGDGAEALQARYDAAAAVVAAALAPLRSGPGALLGAGGRWPPLMLHCARVELTRSSPPGDYQSAPSEREFAPSVPPRRLRVEAPPPAAMRAALAQLGFDTDAALGPGPGGACACA